MPETIPLPAHAASIWLASDGSFMLALPPQPGQDRGHIITLPGTTAGLEAMASLLTQRATEAPGRLDTPGVPSQSLLDHQRNHSSPVEKCPFCRFLRKGTDRKPRAEYASTEERLFGGVKPYRTHTVGDGSVRVRHIPTGTRALRKVRELRLPDNIQSLDEIM